MICMVEGVVEHGKIVDIVLVITLMIVCSSLCQVNTKFRCDYLHDRLKTSPLIILL